MAVKQGNFETTSVCKVLSATQFQKEVSVDTMHNGVPTDLSRVETLSLQMYLYQGNNI